MNLNHLIIIGALCGALLLPSSASSWGFVGLSAGGGPAPGTVLLGLDNSDDWPSDATSNADTAYAYCDTGLATATATTAYIYSRVNSDPVHVCVWSSDGTLLAVSSAIALTGGAGWKSGTISIAITQDTSYIIGYVGDSWVYSKHDPSAPSHPNCAVTNMTYGAEGNLTGGTTCNQSYGNLSVYITN